MDSDHWRRLDELWERVRALAGPEREAFLATLSRDEPALAGELASLLEHSDGDFFLDRPLLASVELAEALPEDPWVGRTLGSYHLLEKVGEGGMSVVYRAERVGQGFEQEVAVKLMRGLTRPELERRFRVERQILAQLEHPSIARLLDGGTEPQGVPYVVMEYVRGRPITAWCDERGLDLDARLALFARVCEAVHFAHRHLVVHRDLKPANILVNEEGEPKLLDFGIAKLLDATDPDLAEPTETLFRALTPGYASPEQIAGRPITTASDVYALGVLLYEMLTGVRPYDLAGLSPAEVERRLLDEPPRLPSAALAAAPATVRRSWGPRQLRGDLDTLILEALRPEPEERYPSAEALAQDLERSRTGQPIRARPSTLGYRLGKFLRRNRLAAALGMLLAGSLLAFALTATLQARRLERERDAALRERQRAEEAVSFLEGIFRLQDPKTQPAARLSTQELLDHQRVQVLEELADRPELQARLLDTLGIVHQHAGLYDEARELFERGLAVRERLYGPHHPETAAIRKNLGLLLGLEGEHEISLRHLGQALEDFEARLPADDPRIADTLLRLGQIQRENGRLEEAAVTLRRAVAVRDQLDAEQGASSLEILAGILQMQGQLDEAKTLCEQAVTELRAAGAPALRIADALNTLGEIYRNRNELVPAEAALREALELYPSSVQESTEVGAVYNNLGVVLRARGDYQGAVEAYAAASAILRKLHGDDHPFIAVGDQNLAKLYLELGDLEAAHAHARQALAILRQALPEGHPNLGLSLRTLAEVYRDQDRPEEALAVADQALAILAAVVERPHPWLASTEATRGSILLALGRREEAAASLEASLADWGATLGPRSFPAADVRLSLARLEAEEGREEGGVRWLEEALDIYRETLGPRHPKVGITLLELALLDRAAGREDAAATHLAEALPLLRASLPPNHPRRLAAEHLAGERIEEALGADRAAARR